MQEEKAVWIDAENRILAFQPIENSKRVLKMLTPYKDIKHN